MQSPIVFDVETKHSFREVSDPRKLGITVVVLYDFKTGKSHAFTESTLSMAFPFFENASYVIGYNIISFDLPVLSAYYPGKVDRFQAFDMLDDVRSIIGRRLGLNDLASATLGKKKSGHGLQAIELYKQGKIDELTQYCTDDVMITKELFDFGVKYKEVYYLNEYGRTTIKVNWGKYSEHKRNAETHMTLPF